MSAKNNNWIDDITMEMLNCQDTILNEIKQKECKRKDIALTYCLCIKSSENIDWDLINRAIIRRWSFSGLKYIKKLAHKTEGWGLWGNEVCRL